MSSSASDCLSHRGLLWAAVPVGGSVGLIDHSYGSGCRITRVLSAAHLLVNIATGAITSMYDTGALFLDVIDPIHKPYLRVLPPQA